MNTGAELIATERAQQLTREGYTDAHDDAHIDGAIAVAAACYALPDFERVIEWPWSLSDWKPTPQDRVRELVKAGALIAAEIDRLQRKAIH